MKFKTFLNNLIAIFAILALAGGFQISSENIVTDLVTTESEIVMNEAYAGPCGRAGCDGQPTYCEPVVVFNIGSIEVIKHCKGTPPEEEQLELL